MPTDKALGVREARCPNCDRVNAVANTAGELAGRYICQRKSQCKTVFEVFEDGRTSIIETVDVKRLTQK